jgi:hypothetical protein
LVFRRPFGSRSGLPGSLASHVTLGRMGAEAGR